MNIRIQPATCDISGKHRYQFEDAALTAAKKLSRQGRPVLDVYRCPWCKAWHLTKVKP